MHIHTYINSKSSEYSFFFPLEQMENNILHFTEKDWNMEWKEFYTTYAQSNNENRLVNSSIQFSSRWYLCAQEGPYYVNNSTELKPTIETHQLSNTVSCNKIYKVNGQLKIKNSHENSMQEYKPDHFHTHTQEVEKNISVETDKGKT